MTYEDLDMLNALQELIISAGGITKLANYLGVEPRAVTDWRRAGKISKIGALLVSRSKVLASLFPIRALRPDMDQTEIDRLREHQYYIDARMRQIDYENRPEFAGSQLYYLQSRFGLQGEGTDGR